MRDVLWSRLTHLASVRGVMPQPDATVSDLIMQIGLEWADAKRRSDWAQRHGLVVQQRRRELEGELDIAREESTRASLKLENAASDFETKDRERRTQERRATDDLNIAEADNVLLTENRMEWKRTRPQLELLIEELRVGSVQSKGASESLSQRLVALRKAVEAQGTTTSSAAPAVPSSPSSPPTVARTQSAVGDAESDAGSPVGSPPSPHRKLAADSAPRASLFSTADSAPESPGARTRELLGENSLAPPLLPAGARESDDPLVRKAAEETDLLYKRVLALEGEKAYLIRSQEELIQYIREKVEPVQRALNSE